MSKTLTLGAAALLLAAGANARAAESLSLSAAGATVANEVLAMSLTAKGVQTYECRADAGAGRWAFVQLRAELFDEHGRPVRYREHAFGRRSRDGNRMLGEVRLHSDLPPRLDAPWLFLEPEDGALRSGRVAAVQRLHNAQGIAPGAPCAPDLLGKVAQVDYSADYRFFTAR